MYHSIQLKCELYLVTKRFDVFFRMESGIVNHSSNLAQITTYSAHGVHSDRTLPDKAKPEGYPVPANNANSANTNDQILSISDEASRLAREESLAGKKAEAKSEQPDTDKPAITDPTQATSPSGQPLSDDEIQQIKELKRRDAEVKAHEQAHLAAAGDLVKGSINLDYETGPDGNRYAVGGEVSIDTSEVAGDPQATLLKAQRIRRAANAPVDPSSQDRAVAAEAAQIEAKARIEISEQARAKQQQFIDENDPEVDFFSARINQTEKDIQNTYSQIQNASVLQEQRSFVDFFI